MTDPISDLDHDNLPALQAEAFTILDNYRPVVLEAVKALLQVGAGDETIKAHLQEARFSGDEVTIALHAAAHMRRNPHLYQPAA